jgi:hypothetical protein
LARHAGLLTTFRKTFCSIFVFAFLNQNINFIIILIDGPPKVMQNTVDLDKHFIKILGIAQLPSALPEMITIHLTEFITPISDGLVTNGNTSCCQ